MATDRSPAPWWAINGFGLLVALLEVFLGVTGIMAGVDTGAGWVYRVGITGAGTGLLYGYWHRRIDIEVYAAVTMVAANLVDFGRETLTVWPPLIDWRGLILQAIIIVGVSARVWALLRGGVITIPAWHRDA